VEDRDADFTGFVRARQAYLVRFAWLVSGSYAAAEDLVQDALSHAYARWDRLDDPEAYVRTAIVRRNVSVWRKVRREVLLPWHVDRVTPVANDADADGRLVAAVHALPAKQRMAIVARFWCDLDDKQAAQMLGCSVVTVRSNISRALQRLRDTRSPHPGPDAGAASCRSVSVSHQGSGT
jgi:RNA polymerase sigma-70 factor (sigma-E family)